MVRDPNGELTWSCSYASFWHGVYPCHEALHAVVQLINNEEVCLAPEGSLVEEVRSLPQQVPSTVLSYIPRQANALLIVLHSLASENEISHTGWNWVSHPRILSQVFLGKVLTRPH